MGAFPGYACRYLVKGRGKWRALVVYSTISHSDLAKFFKRTPVDAEDATDSKLDSRP